MPYYRRGYRAYAFTSIVVKADSVEDAEEAFEKCIDEYGFPDVCGQCGGWGNYTPVNGIEINEVWEETETIEETEESENAFEYESKDNDE